MQSLLNDNNDCIDHLFQIRPEFCMEDASKFGLIFSDRGSYLVSVANKSKQGGTAGSFQGSCPQLFSDQCTDGDQSPTGLVDRLVE